MTPIPLLVPSLGCRALKDGLLYGFFLLALVGLMTVFLFLVNWAARSFASRGMDSHKQTTISKGASR